MVALTQQSKTALDFLPGQFVIMGFSTAQPVPAHAGAHPVAGVAQAQGHAGIHP